MATSVSIMIITSKTGVIPIAILVTPTATRFTPTGTHVTTTATSNPTSN